MLTPEHIMSMSTRTAAATTPSEGRDWDPEAALRRLADGDVTELTARLYRAAEVYAQAPEGHLSFEEMQAVVAGDARLEDLAKLRFETGDSMSGFESLTHYVSANNAAAGKALQVGFVEPIKVADSR
jgi:hypothetical protein